MTALPPDARAGLFGKLPARGDFVRENLPRDFIDSWDAWWQRGLGETQHRPRDEWTAAWLEAPVWRFLLPPGLCGRNGVLGIWLPSVDKAGRYSPLTIAATAPVDWAPSVGAMTSFLAAAEQAGCDALEHDLAPGDLLQRIQDAFVAADAPVPAPDLAPGQAAWWTEGGPRVAARLETATALPEGSRFAALIDDDWGTAEPPAELAIARTDPS
ncbi:MAG: type VI secretion system-associated protein TagF [Reyranella sp.]